MTSEQQESWGVEQQLDNLSSAELVASRREAARELGTLTESNERIVRALLDARDTDTDEEVRREAAQALNSAPHREIIRNNAILTMRIAAQPEVDSTALFEAWEPGVEPGAGAEHWTVELSGASATFTKEESQEKIVVPGAQANSSIVIPAQPPVAGIGTGLPEGGMAIQVEGRNLVTSRAGYGKLADWLEKCRDRTGTMPRVRKFSWWIVGLAAFGGVQLAVAFWGTPQTSAGGFGLFWGILFLVLAGLNFFLPLQKMLFPNGLALMFGGFWFVLFAGSQYSMIGYLPALWGTMKVFEVLRNR